MSSIDKIVEKYTNEIDKKNMLNEMPDIFLSLSQGVPLWYLQTILIILYVMYGVAFLGVLRSSPAYDFLEKFFNKIKNKFQNKFPSALERFIEEIESDPEWPVIKKKLTNMDTKQMIKYFNNYIKEKGLNTKIKVVHAATEKYWDELGV